MHKKNLLFKGVSLEEAKRVLIMLHGRGASAQDIVGLSDHLAVQDYCIIAPQATGNTWYPYSFMAPGDANEPWLSSAIALIDEIVGDVETAGVNTSNIYLLGFSQGACLTLEFAARKAKRYGGVVAFTGGLIGDKIYPEKYSGDFAGTPIYIGTSDPDPHVPVARVKETTLLLRKMNAVVSENIFPQMGHTINQNEIDHANRLVFTAG